MLEGLIAAIVLFFAPAAREPDVWPLVRLDTHQGMPTQPDLNAVVVPPTFVTVQGGGQLLLDGKLEGFATIFPALRAKVCDKTDCKRVFIVADSDVPYGDVLSFVSAVRQNGFDRVGLIEDNCSNSPFAPYCTSDAVLKTR